MKPTPMLRTLVICGVLFAAVGATSHAAQGPEPELLNPAREAWRIDVAPFAVLGTGHPGTLPVDMRPDGVAFTPAGLLLVTDAVNRRVQVWDPRTALRLGEFGRDVFGGEITNIAVSRDGTVYVADSVLNIVYVWKPQEGEQAGPAAYKFAGIRTGEEKWRKLGGLAIDSQGRLYVADGKLWEVRRYTPDGKSDPSWRFERTLADGDTVLHRCEGLAIDEERRLLYVASESDFVLKVFDLETGAFKRTVVGARADANGRPTGTLVFGGPIEGLEVEHGLMLAVDESGGAIHILRLAEADLMGSDLTDFNANRAKGPTAYVGFFGHGPRVNFDVDDNPNPDWELNKRVHAGEVVPGMANPPGYFCSPDEIAAFTEKDGNETYIAVADQCNFRVVLYRWSDIRSALTRRVIESAPRLSQPAPTKNR